MVKKSKRMTSIRKLVKQEERNQAMLLGEIQQKLLHEQNQIAQLKLYFNSYNGQMDNWASTKLNGRTLTDFNLFMSQLKFAIGEQGKNIDKVNQELEQQRKAWLQANNKLKVIDNYIARLKVDEAVQDSKQEQKIIDELCARYSGRMKPIGKR